MSSGLAGRLDIIATTPPTFAIHGPIARSDLRGLARRICALLRQTPSDTWICEVGGVEPDAVTVDALARLQLAAHRNHTKIQLENASKELKELLALMGLDQILPTRPDAAAGRTAGTGAPSPGRK